MWELSYDDTMARLEEMRERYSAGFSSSDRDKLEALNTLLFGKEITRTGCSDCYRDAYLLIRSRLKKEKTMPQPTTYSLKAGIVIHAFGSPDYYTLDIPDSVAEDYLRGDNTRIREFSRYPSDWERRLKPPIEERQQARKERRLKKQQA